MKKYLSYLLLLISLGTYFPSFSQSTARPVYVIVHGAWGGSWAFKEVDSLLTSRGCVLYRPCLTGQGERVHLASTEVGLNTHIMDVVNIILYEDLHDVILVGHSYGGMVITGVADSLPGRIKKLIYVDAFVPVDGESALSIQRSGGDWLKERNVNGFVIPPWVPEGKLPPKDVPHSFKTLSDPIYLKNNVSQNIPSVYILTVEKGTSPGEDKFASEADKARARGWPVFQLESDHNPQWSAPGALVDMLKIIGDSY